MDGPNLQNFSIPSNIIYYMGKNPSNSQVYGKMIHCCKYFFYKNPIVVTNGIIYKKNEFWITNTVTSQTNPDAMHEIDDGITLITQNDDGDEIIEQLSGNGNMIAEDLSQPFEDIKIQDIPHKLWLDGDLELDGCPSEKIIYLIEKVYQWNLDDLILSNQIINYEDYQKIVATKKLKTLSLKNVAIKKPNGDIVQLEKLLDGLKNLNEVNINDSHISTFFSLETVGNLLKLPCFENLKVFDIGTLPETFDIETFSKFAKKHQNTMFGLNYARPTSDATNARITKVATSLSKILKKNYFHVYHH